MERLIEVFNKVNKIYLKNSKPKLAKCYGNLLDGQAIVICIVLMSRYNKENMSLYNFKRGCVITEKNSFFNCIYDPFRGGEW